MHTKLRYCEATKMITISCLMTISNFCINKDKCVIIVNFTFYFYTSTDVGSLTTLLANPC